MFKSHIGLATLALGATALAAGATPSDQSIASEIGPRWQARLGVATTAANPLPSLGRPPGSGVGQLQSASLMGDFYFGRVPGVRAAWATGLRATGGVLVGPRYTLASALVMPSAQAGLALGRQALLQAEGGSSATLPYLGLGYSSTIGKHGLSIQADVGVLMQNPSSLPHLGRALIGSARMDDVLRELRWAPLVTVGVSYAF